MNMPGTAVSYTTPAVAGVTGTDEQTYFPTNIGASRLVAGTNLIAVEIHQNTASSSDLGFDLELAGSGYVMNPEPPILNVTHHQVDGTLLSWPANAVGWSLYWTPLLPAAGGWQPWYGSVVRTNGLKQTYADPQASRGFFRLQRP
jgi:hypothetical protein